jgi:hypothetical protein
MWFGCDMLEREERERVMSVYDKPENEPHASGAEKQKKTRMRRQSENV